MGVNHVCSNGDASVVWGCFRNGFVHLWVHVVTFLWLSALISTTLSCVAMETQSLIGSLLSMHARGDGLEGLGFVANGMGG